MDRKKELERGIFIDDDLTKKDREIQQRLRRRAYEEREKEEKCKSYKRIWMKEKWYSWDKNKGKLHFYKLEITVRTFCGVEYY